MQYIRKSLTHKTILRGSAALLFLTSNVSSEVISDGSLGTKVALSGPDYRIGAKLGQQHGTNLFHSFSVFGLNTGESANFDGPMEVQNVLARVTGGAPSNIDGTLRSSIKGADLYLLNPAGLMFGANARLDISGSFHAATADYVHMQDGTRFSTDSSQSNSLSTAPPAAFGFFDDSSVATLHVTATLGVPAGETLALSGSRLHIEEAELSATGGRIELDTPESGEVALHRSLVDVSDGGGVFIRAGRFMAADSSLDARSLGTQDGGVIDIQAQDVSLREGTLLDGSTLGPGHGADIAIQAAHAVTLRGENADGQETVIAVRSGKWGSHTGDDLGDAGRVHVQAETLSVLDGAGISGTTYGGGNGGEVLLDVEQDVVFSGYQQSVESASYLAGATYSKSPLAGDGGSVEIRARRITFSDGAYLSSSTGLSSSPTGSGHGGHVRLFAEEKVTFRGEAPFDYFRPSEINMATRAGGDSGDVRIEAREIAFLDGARIFSAAGGTGNACQVELHARDSVVLQGVNRGGNGSVFTTQVSSSVTSAHVKGGGITITTRDLDLSDGSRIASTAFGAGAAGSIDIRAEGAIRISGTNQGGWPAGIFSDSDPQKTGYRAGAGGDIRILANALQLEDGGRIAASSIALPETQSNRAGRVEIHVNGETALHGVNPHGANQLGWGSGIYARSLGSGDNAGAGGEIVLDTGSLHISSGAMVASGTNNQAPGGTITLHVRDALSIDGSADEVPQLEPAASQQDYAELLQNFPELQDPFAGESVSGIYTHSQSTSDNAGDGGAIQIRTGTLQLSGQSRVSAASAGGGEAGKIRIESEGRVHLSGDSAISTEALHAGGGQLEVSSGEILELRDSDLTTSVRQGAGHGGDMDLDARFVVQQDGYIIAKAYEGDGGNIQITTKGIYQFPLSSPAAGKKLIDASSKFGQDGLVAIHAPETDVSGGLVILSTDFIEQESLATSACSIVEAADASRIFLRRARPGVSTEGSNDFLPAIGR